MTKHEKTRDSARSGMKECSQGAINIIDDVCEDLNLATWHGLVKALGRAMG